MASARVCAFLVLALLDCSASAASGGSEARDGVTTPIGRADPDSAAAASCRANAVTWPADRRDAAEAWRAAVQAGPLYAAARAAALPAACSLRDESGVFTVTYRFADGSTLTARREARSESAEQELRLASAGAQIVQQPLDLLARAERAAFGEGGCGIDYERGDTQPSSVEPRATETVYRGDTCNCQARVRRSSSGQVTALLLRSSC